MSRLLNIISFNVPYPPDYGGVIDVFYKIKALQAQGIEVILHTFYHDRQPAPQLESIAEEVYYYPRKNAIESISLRRPLMMNSRRGAALLKNLQQNEAPILFEGIQTASYLGARELQERKKIVRIHNVEWKYYKALKESATSWTKRMQYSWETRMLQSAEHIFSRADLLLPISERETAYYAAKFKEVKYLPVFHANEEVTSKPGKGEFLLYHGNLSVPENEKAVLFFIEKVAPYIEYPLIVAGKEPATAIRKICERHRNVELAANPTQPEIDRLMEDAHIHLLHTFQDTGVKLKLLNALYKGRFCIGNEKMLAGTGVESVTDQANEPGEYINRIKELVSKSFTKEDRDKRKEILQANFDNRANGKKLVEWIF